MHVCRMPDMEYKHRY